MFITICVIAYNEEQTLPAILKDIAAQDYAHGSMEVVLVDSASSDHTKKIMQEFAAQNTPARCRHKPSTTQCCAPVETRRSLGKSSRPY